MVCAPPENLMHIVINNEAHESVGGQPTAVSKIDLCEIVGVCGYHDVVCADTWEKLLEEFNKAKKN